MYYSAKSPIPTKKKGEEMLSLSFQLPTSTKRFIPLQVLYFMFVSYLLTFSEPPLEERENVL